MKRTDDGVAEGKRWTCLLEVEIPVLVQHFSLYYYFLPQYSKGLIQSLCNNTSLTELFTSLSLSLTHIYNKMLFPRIYSFLGTCAMINWPK